MAAIGRTVSIMKTLEVRFLAQSTRCLPVSINIVDPVLLGEPQCHNKNVMNKLQRYPLISTDLVIKNKMIPNQNLFRGLYNVQCKRERERFYSIEI